MATGKHISGQYIETSRTNARSYSVWVPPRACMYVLGAAVALTDTRAADGKYYLNRAAAGGAETDNIIIPLNHGPMMVTDSADALKREVVRGINPTSVKFVYGVGVVDATTITAELHDTTFVQGAAETVDSNSVTVTTAATKTAHATNRYFAVYTFALDAAPTTTSANLQIEVVLANTGTFQFYGAFVNGTLLL